MEFRDHIKIGPNEKYLVLTEYSEDREQIVS